MTVEVVTGSADETEALAGRLAEHLVVVDKRTCRNLRRSVERQRQHSLIETVLRAPPACRKRTVKRGDGNTPAPASGHSTNAIASSK